MTSSIIENIYTEDDEFFIFPIDDAIKFSPKIATGFFIPIGAKKKVRIELQGSIEHKLKLYKKKGLDNIVLGRSDYEVFLKRAKKGLSIYFFEELGDEDNILSDNEIFSLLRKSISYLGMSEKLCDICEPIIKEVINFIRSSKNLSPLYKIYRKNCQEQFIFHIFKSYISIAFAEALEWLPHLYEKFVLVNLLCDLQLTQKDYELFYMNEDDPCAWSRTYRDHPKLMASFLEKHHSHNIAREVIKSIGQHEEYPDGSGFPYAMQAAAFDQMTAIIITSKILTKKLLEGEHLNQERSQFIDDFCNKNINFKHFKNINTALYTIMNLGDTSSRGFNDLS